MSSVSTWIVVVSALLLTEPYVQAKEDQEGGGFGESIALVDMAPFHISSACNILNLKGIQAGAMGSRGYNIFVQKKDVKRATEILIADAKHHPTRYIALEGYKGPLGVAKPYPWKKIKFDVDVEKLSSSKILQADGLLRGFARDGAKKMKTIIGGKPILKEIWYLPLDYVDGKGKTQNAIQAVAKFGYKGKSEEFQAGGWTWNLGRESFIQNGGGEIP